MDLYHYTSNQNFLSIIESKRLRLSDLTLSNDTSEGRYALNLIKEANRKLNVNIEPFLNLDIFGSYFSALGFCMSTEADMLSQWRAYASDGEGVSIGVDGMIVNGWVEKSNKKDEGYSSSSVIYDKSVQISKIKDELSTQAEVYQNKVKEFQSNYTLGAALGVDSKYQIKRDKMVSETIKYLFPAMKYLFIYKDSFFKEESEFRLIRNITKSQLKSPEFNFRSSRNKIVPYQEYPEHGLAASDIKKIVLGPKNITPKEYVESFLERYSFTGVEVVRSNGSYI